MTRSDITMMKIEDKWAVLRFDKEKWIDEALDKQKQFKTYFDKTGFSSQIDEPYSDYGFRF